MSKLEEGKFDSRREVPFTINLKNIYKVYEKTFYERPVKFIDSVTRKIESFSKKLMTGYGAVLGVPAGIMIRNSATVANETLNDGDKKFGWVGTIGAIAGAGAAWWLAGSALFAQIGTAVGAASTVAQIGTGIVAAVASAPVLAPAIAVGVIAASVIMGAGTFAISTIPALMNVKVGLLRTIDRVRGVKYSAQEREEMQKALNENSISTDYDTKQYNEATSRVYGLKKEDQLRVYDGLKDKFEKAIKEKAAEDITPAAPGPAPTA